MIKNIATYIFSGIWVIFLVFFIIMARQSFQSIDIKLPQYQYSGSKDGEFHLSWDNVSSEVEKIAESHNTALMKLEESIRSEAKTMSLINFYKDGLLGFIQGATELLPVSSSGHLLIVSDMINKDPIAREYIKVVFIEDYKEECTQN
jgi:hypothetical protein